MQNSQFSKKAHYKKYFCLFLKKENTITIYVYGANFYFVLKKDETAPCVETNFKDSVLFRTVFQK